MLLIFTNVIGFMHDTLDIIILEIQIIVIYAIFQFLVWMYDKKAANEINEKLNIIREELEIKKEEE
ncbi:preprotein translocase subunit YajC [Clostridium beijerinckii]|nr:preprotein translocase subunit YajC [Clostridium beijerinckii]